MNLRQLLSSDVRTLGQSSRAGLNWWLRELGEMVPPSLWQGARRASVIAELSADGTAYRLWRDGRPLAGAPPGGKVELVLSASHVLTRELHLPDLPSSDLRRMISLDLDRLTPFGPEAVYFDVDSIGRDAASGRQLLMLGVLPREAAHAALRHAEALGLEPEGLSVSDDPRAGTVQFDFLQHIRAEGAGAAPRRLLYWWAGVGALVAANLAALIVKDINDVASLRRAVEAQRPAANAALHLRRRIETERAQRALLLQRRAVGDPLRPLAAVSRVLPKGAWVQHFVWNGRGVRIVGFKNEGADVVAALRAAPEFANVRSQATEVDTGVAGQPFDVTADAARGGVR